MLLLEDRFQISQRILNVVLAAIRKKVVVFVQQYYKDIQCVVEEEKSKENCRWKIPSI